MDIKEIYNKIFNQWCEKNAVSDRKIYTIKYTPRNVAFTNEDARISATRDDFYKESYNSQKIDVEDLKDYMESIWMEEIGKEGVQELNYNISDIYSESESLFNRGYIKWAEEWIKSEAAATEIGIELA